MSFSNDSEAPPAKPIELPILMPGQMHGSQLSLGSQLDQPDFLSYNPRTWGERMVYNTGICYLSGLALGGLRGTYTGLTSSPSKRWKIRFNTFLNHTGRGGSRAGNALGTVALMYSLVEAGADYADVDRRLGNDSVAPVLAAAATGALYKCTAGPKVAVLAAAMAGGLMGAATQGSKLLPNGYGLRQVRSFFF
jgi:import inner membrane translocase subunit TIM23